METYILTKTDDGSLTLLDINYNQTMHSLSGAWEEAIKKHVIPSKVLETIKDNIKVLDVGFGLGYNIAALIHNNNNNKKISITSLEKNQDIKKYLNQIHFNDDRDDSFKIVTKAFNNKKYKDNLYAIEVIFGDAKKTIFDLNDNSYDAIFFDPFSPSKNPELWTKQIFNQISRIIKKDGILTTYSQAPQVRGALHANGFYLGKGPSVGGKREGTLASLTPSVLDSSLNSDELNDLLDNYKSEPYDDPNQNLSAQEILNNRILAMAEIRKKINN